MGRFTPLPERGRPRLESHGSLFPGVRTAATGRPRPVPSARSGSPHRGARYPNAGRIVSGAGILDRVLGDAHRATGQFPDCRADDAVERELQSYDGWGTVRREFLREALRPRRLLPRRGGRGHPHARGGGPALRSRTAEKAGRRARHRMHPRVDRGPTSPRTALPPEARQRAPRGATGLGRRPELQPAIPRPPHVPAAARWRASRATASRSSPRPTTAWWTASRAST
jgi:hypothetical protein